MLEGIDLQSALASWQITENTFAYVQQLIAIIQSSRALPQQNTFFGSCLIAQNNMITYEMSLLFVFNIFGTNIENSYTSLERHRHFEQTAIFMRDLIGNRSDTDRQPGQYFEASSDFKLHSLFFTNIHIACILHRLSENPAITPRTRNSSGQDSKRVICFKKVSQHAPYLQTQAICHLRKEILRIWITPGSISLMLLTSWKLWGGNFFDDNNW